MWKISPIIVWNDFCIHFSYTGPYYAGGLVFEPAPDTKGWKLVTLTSRQTLK